VQGVLPPAVEVRRDKVAVARGGGPLDPLGHSSSAAPRTPAAAAARSFSRCIWARASIMGPRASVPLRRPLACAQPLHGLSAHSLYHGCFCCPRSASRDGRCPGR
jgi:hypothetical protein